MLTPLHTLHYTTPHRWIIKPPSTSGTKHPFPRTKLSKCNDQHCLLSTRRIDHAHQSIRCGRCCGTFHIEALFEISSSPSTPEHPLQAFLVPPSKELLEPQSHDEWFCPLCLQEDTNTQIHRYSCHHCPVLQSTVCTTLHCMHCTLLSLDFTALYCHLT
jgi:hypothetical protein